jgi:hypothetical protein
MVTPHVTESLPPGGTLHRTLPARQRAAMQRDRVHASLLDTRCRREVYPVRMPMRDPQPDRSV